MDLNDIEFEQYAEPEPGKNLKALELFLTNLFRVGKNQTNESFNEETLDVLRQTAGNALRQGRTNIDYEDYPDITDTMSARGAVASTKERSGMLNTGKQALTNPVGEAVYSIGGATLEVDEDDNVYLTDNYDFSKIPLSSVKDAYGALRYAAGYVMPDEGSKTRIFLGKKKDLLESDPIQKAVNKVKPKEKKKNYNVGVSKGGVSFNEAYAHFKKKGQKTFTWNGKRYATD